MSKKRTLSKKNGLATPQRLPDQERKTIVDNNFISAGDLSQLFGKESPEEFRERETAYRSGYLNGWKDAVERVKSGTNNVYQFKDEVYPDLCDEWQNDLSRHDPENNKSRGYADGFIEAVHAIWDLVDEKDMPLVDACKKCRWYTREALEVWAKTDLDKEVPPPKKPLNLWSPFDV